MIKSSGKKRNSKGKPENLRPFKPGQSGNPKGRAPKYITTVTDKTGYRNSEIADCMKSMLKMTIGEISEIQKSKDAPILEKLLAAGIQSDLQKGDLRNLESILNRSYGKPKEQIEIDDNTNPYNLQPSILAAAIIMNERQLKDEKKQ
jgi:hypothetical protein